ncbi:MAG: AI-2E family transporter [Gammaproteobacteria bacterium]|nr:AI-2E family transporter [Gammaproteobacteria bacterium]
MLAQDTFKFYLSLALLLAAAWLLHGFIPALLWAVVIVIATWPLRQRLADRSGFGATALATVMTALVTAVFFVPIIYALVNVAAEAGNVAHWITAVQQTGIAVPSWLANIPLLGSPATNWWQQNLADPAALATLLGQTDSATLTEYARAFGGEIAHRLIMLIFTLLTIFFLYQHGEQLAHKTLALLVRLTGDSGRRYGLQAAVAIRATVSGLVLVGLAEGLLIGIAYAMAGAPHPAILGLLTGVLAMIPFAAPIILVIVAGMLSINSGMIAAVAVFAFGMGVMFVGDHFVRPKIIGDAVKLPFLWVLLGILGGVEVFGLIGLFVGPALMALVMTMWRDMTDAS